MPVPRRVVPEVVVAVLAVLAAVTGLAWQLTADPSPTVGDEPSFWALPVTAALGYGVTGGVLAWLDRATVVRRVLLGIGLTQGLTLLAGLYADAGLAAAQPWPGVAWAHWVASWLWSPAYVAVGAVLPLVLPDGRPLWRPAALLSGVAVGWTAVSWALTPYHLQDFPSGSGLTNPVGVDVVAHPVIVGGGAALVLAAVSVALASTVVRWRRSTGAARDQLKWLLVGLGASVGLAAAGLLSGAPAAEALSALAMLPFPVAVGVALLRHRLWDVDVLLSRSLLYGLLTGGVVAGYVVAVALLGSLLGNSAGTPVLATALVALLVLPLHARLQRLVNRLVHGHADDPYTALARLGDRLEAVAEPAQIAEQVLPELVRQVAAVLRLPFAGVVLADGSTVEHGTRPAQTTRTPLLFAGTEVGALVVAGDGLTRHDRRILVSLARQAAVAVHTVLLARDVQRARTATATAREEERRRLRRDLHDGMGPALAGVALQAETARELVDADPIAAKALLDRLVPRLNEAVADVRTLVHDLRPPSLDELGLEGALHELGSRFATPTRSVRVEVGPLSPLPAAVDLAAYRIAAEALSNAARHADATCVLLRITRDTDQLRLCVTDDGVGVAPHARAGVGLRSMRERAEELGGSCTVAHRASGAGTVVEATIPLGSMAPATAQRVVVAPPAPPPEQVPA